VSAEILIEKINLFFPAALRPKYVAMVEQLSAQEIRALLTRAADALEDLRGPGWKRELIDELRKAAQ
jgi:hypothetical protein